MSLTEAKGGVTPFVWHDCRLIAAPTVHQFYVGGLSALFCERRQELFALNATADCIWRGFARGCTPAQVSAELTALGFTELDANAFIRDAAISWLNAGQLTPQEVLERLGEPPAAIRDLRIHQVATRIRFFGIVSPTEFDTVFGQFNANASAPAVDLSVVGSRQSCFIFEAGAPLLSCTAEQLIPHLKALLTERYVSSVENGFLVHGALLRRHNRSLLICGAPGAGKTTLCVALACSGYEYRSDDVVLIDRDAAAVGVPFAPAVKKGAWPLVAVYAPEVNGLPTYRRSDGQYVRYLPQSGSTAPCVISDVILLARQPAASAALVAIEPLEMVSTILESAFSAKGALDALTLKTFAHAIESAGCYRLVYSAVEDAVHAIASLGHG